MVTISQLKRSAQTDENGVYEFAGIPAGRYDIVAHIDHVPDVLKTIEVTAAGSTTADFQLKLSSIREQVTVTATGSAESIDDSYQAVTSVGALELAEKSTISIGEALKNQLGVANRSFGPGACLKGWFAGRRDRFAIG